MRESLYKLEEISPKQSVTSTFQISSVLRFKPSLSFFSLAQSAMEPTFASQAANKQKIEQEMEASSPPAIRTGRKDVELKETGHSIWSSVNKFASQIKKASHRRSHSPLNWFPRKKTTDSFLKRKIKLLQEGGGMSLSLVETLGNANPHYSRIAREKIAAQEAASKAMEARKAAMVEASWCRILQAARINSKEAESKLERAEICASEAFEEAKLMGVMMFDRPDCPRRSCDVLSASHTVTASFETEFEVDREVAAAVKKAFIILSNRSSSSNKEEFRDLLRKIKQNPDDHETLTASPHCELDQEVSHRKSSYGMLLDYHEDNSSNSTENLVSIMVDRLKELQEDELSSLATIVATCGLNAALLEMQRSHDHENEHDAPRKSNVSRFAHPTKKNKEETSNVPSLDKFLVKHVSRLEREVQQAQMSKKDDDLLVECDTQLKQSKNSQNPTSDLGSILIKHVSKLEREIQEAKNSQKQNPKAKNYQDLEQPEVQSTVPKSLTEEKNLAMKLREITNGIISKSDRINKVISHHDIRDKSEARKSFSCRNRDGINDFQQTSLDKVLIKPVHWLDREKMQMQALETGNMPLVRKKDRQMEKIELVSKIESLDEILVRHQSKLERAKLEATRDSENSIKKVDARREARERELEKAWGGMSLGNSLRPHLSKLEKEKAAWRRAEQEEKICIREC